MDGRVSTYVGRVGRWTIGVPSLSVSGRVRRIRIVYSVP